MIIPEEDLSPRGEITVLSLSENASYKKGVFIVEKRTNKRKG